MNKDKHRLFSNEAVEKIYAYTHGVPRLINSLCDSSLVYGYGGSLDTIGSNIIEEVIEDRGIDPGIQNEGVTRDEEAPPEKATLLEPPERLGDYICSEISRVHERITKMEHRLTELENVKSQQAISELFEWFKEVQKENRKLHEQYNALSLKSKRMNRGNKSDDMVMLRKKA